MEVESPSWFTFVFFLWLLQSVAVIFLLLDFTLTHVFAVLSRLTRGPLQSEGFCCLSEKDYSLFAHLSTLFSQLTLWQ